MQKGQVAGTVPPIPSLEEPVMNLVLIADEHPQLRHTLSEILKNQGFDEILEVENGPRAVDLALARKPRLILLDAALNALDGITAAEKISKRHPVPIILLAEAHTPVDFDRTRAAGVLDLVLKPFSTAQMIASIRLTLQHFEEISGLRQEVARLTENLEVRKLIERAKGLLIRQGMSEPDAYRRMQKLSMDKRKTLREVAEAILLMED